jgi:hypothetical protein
MWPVDPCLIQEGRALQVAHRSAFRRRGVDRCCRSVDDGPATTAVDGGVDVAGHAALPAADAGGVAVDRLTQTLADYGEAGPYGLGGPAAGDQLAVPTQDGGWRDQEPEASSDREQSGEGGEQGAVGPAHPGARGASLEHGELVTQDQDLDLLGGVGSGVQHDPAQELGEHLVDQPQRHQRIMPGPYSGRTGRSRLCALFRAPTGAVLDAKPALEQRRFSRAIRTTKAASTSSTGGRPIRFG